MAATATVTTADGRPLVPCRSEHPTERIGSGYQHVRCNEIRGHQGPHRHRDTHTFAVIVEWPRA